MNNSRMDELPPATRELIASAGYRMVRWQAAREVLRHRVAKGRIAGDLGEFLTHWLAEDAEPVPAAEINLTFSLSPEHAWLVGGNSALAEAPLERALLHLPALRRFWVQELRLQHFTALRASVPTAWPLDDAAVPPGAVIHGLDLSSWGQWNALSGRELMVCSGQGAVALDLPVALVSRKHFLCVIPAAGQRIAVDYQRDDKGRIVLRSIAASS